MKKVATSLIVVLSIGGCGERSVSSGRWLRGLDRAVVEEVLANPDAHDIRDEVLEGVGDEGGPRGAAFKEDFDQMTVQAIVIQFIVCRDVARVYEGWRDRGKMPALAPPPRPESQLGVTYWGWPGVRDYLQRRRDEGDHASLRRWVTGPTSEAKRPSTVTTKTPCGQWIPAKPDDVDGPTIAQAIEAKDP